MINKDKNMNEIKAVHPGHYPEGRLGNVDLIETPFEINSICPEYVAGKTHGDEPYIDGPKELNMNSFHVKYNLMSEKEKSMYKKYKDSGLSWQDYINQDRELDTLKD